MHGHELCLLQNLILSSDHRVSEIKGTVVVLHMVRVTVWDTVRKTRWLSIKQHIHCVSNPMMTLITHQIVKLTEKSSRTTRDSSSCPLTDKNFRSSVEAKI